jgi:hypothetical protein
VLGGVCGLYVSVSRQGCNVRTQAATTEPMIQQIQAPNAVLHVSVVLKGQWDLLSCSKVIHSDPANGRKQSVDQITSRTDRRELNIYQISTILSMREMNVLFNPSSRCNVLLSGPMVTSANAAPVEKNRTKANAMIRNFIGI